MLGIRFKIFCCNLLLVMLAIVAFFAARYPYLDRPFIGEEGLFAHIIGKNIPGPDYLYLARINSRPVYGAPSHPAPIYEVLKLMGYLLPQHVSQLPQSEITSTYRLLNTTPFFLFFLLLVIYGVCMKPEQSIGARVSQTALLSVIAASAIAARETLLLQTDQTSGVIFTGALALSAVYHKSFSNASFSRMLVVFLAAIISGIGKQEWSICVFSSALGSLLLSPYFVIARRKEILFFFGLIIIGNASGNIISYVYDSFNYIDGIRMLVNMVNKSTVVGHGFDFFIDSIERRLYYTIPVSLPLVTSIIFSIKRRSSIQLLFLILLCCSLYVSFMISSWAIGDYRYFMPALTIGMAALVISFPNDLKRKSDILVVVVIFAAISIGICDEITNSLPKYQMSDVAYTNKNRELEAKSFEQHCVAFMDSGYAFDKTIDFTISSLGPEGARALLERNHATSPLCR